MVTFKADHNVSTCIKKKTRSTRRFLNRISVKCGKNKLRRVESMRIVGANKKRSRRKMSSGPIKTETTPCVGRNWTIRTTSTTPPPHRFASRIYSIEWRNKNAPTVRNSFEETERTAIWNGIDRRTISEREPVGRGAGNRVARISRALIGCRTVMTSLGTNERLGCGRPRYQTAIKRKENSFEKKKRKKWQ